MPFCRRRCAYCDFAIAVRRSVPVDEFIGALGRELDLRVERESSVAREPWELETLYLGGGTPSLLGADGVTRLLSLVRTRATLAADAEVTLEANPDDVTPAAARAWLECGVNRLSIGGQSFEPDVLAWMHRTHTADQIARAVHTAREVGLHNLSIDLIFSVPEHLHRDWARDLDRAIELEPAHVSLYGLTIEQGTPLGRWVARGAVSEAPEERYEREYLAAHDRLVSAGLEHYEVSNFARPGFRSRHNSMYWSGRPWLGLGPSAHEFDGRRRRWNVAPYAEWVRRVCVGRDPIAGEELLTDENRATERTYLALRTDVGLTLSEDQARRVIPWIEAGWASIHDGGVLRLTPEGWLRLDTLAGDLTIVRSHY